MSTTSAPGSWPAWKNPTLIVLKAGKVLDQRVGKMSKEALLKLVEPHL